MTVDVPWIVLHGGHEGAEFVTFEAAFGGLVSLLVVVGALYYLGVFEQSGGSGDEESDAGTAD